MIAPKRDRGSDETRTGRRQRELAGDVLHAERERAEIVGIEENPAQRDGDDDARIAADRRAAIDETGDIGGDF